MESGLDEREKTKSYKLSYSPKMMIGYDYMTEDGVLFTTLANNIDEAREKRDRWLKEEYPCLKPKPIEKGKILNKKAIRPKKKRGK